MRLSQIFENTEQDWATYAEDFWDPECGYSFEEYDWHFDPEFPVSGLVSQLRNSATERDWQYWLETEIRMHEGDRNDYWANMYRAMPNETIHTPIVVSMQPRIRLHDGWHRTAASIVGGKFTIPAVVGTWKNR